TTWARKLLHLLDASMLVLMDRGFDGADFLAEVAATKAQFLVRLTATRRPPVLRRFPDGSFLSVIGGVKVRIIPADVIVTCHDGTRYGDRYRLATTILDWRAYPATALIRLYHERWEHEITYLALRHTLLKGRVLRSGDPEGVKQEMWALLAVETAQLTVTSARGILPATPDLAGDIGRAVLASLHGPRRPRVCARKVKSPLSRWNKNPPGKPSANLRITALTTVITDYQDKPATRQRRSSTQMAGP